MVGALGTCWAGAGVVNVEGGVVAVGTAAGVVLAPGRRFIVTRAAKEAEVSGATLPRPVAEVALIVDVRWSLSVSSFLPSSMDFSASFLVVRVLAAGLAETRRQSTKPTRIAATAAAPPIKPPRAADERPRDWGSGVAVEVETTMIGEVWDGVLVEAATRVADLVAAAGTVVGLVTGAAAVVAAAASVFSGAVGAFEATGWPLGSSWIPVPVSTKKDDVQG